MTKSPDLKIGLIGDNIAQSKSPILHRLAGEQNGLVVQYDRLVPKNMGEDFDTLFDRCAARGYRGINVTYPYKERAAKKVAVQDPTVRAIGAVNTVLFDQDGPVGLNTDYTGFMAGYHSVMGETPPGIACLIGTGGVGRAIAFGLVALEAREIRLIDRDEAKAQALAAELRAFANGPEIAVWTDAVEAARGATGLLNGTPVGMVGHAGTPLPRTAMFEASWAFDAVYTPVDTEFLRDAESTGLAIYTGEKFFFHQAIHAWTLFSGLPVNEAGLQRSLLLEGEAA